jgi:hypothetical protein
MLDEVGGQLGRHQRRPSSALLVDVEASGELHSRSTGLGYLAYLADLDEHAISNA